MKKFQVMQALVLSTLFRKYQKNCFILTGLDIENNDQVIIAEFEQWKSANLTDKYAIVKTKFQYGAVETSHSSYQAWPYSELLNQLSETIYSEISISPLAPTFITILKIAL